MLLDSTLVNVFVVIVIAAAFDYVMMVMMMMMMMMMMVMVVVVMMVMMVMVMMMVMMVMMMMMMMMMLMITMTMMMLMMVAAAVVSVSSSHCSSVFLHVIPSHMKILDTASKPPLDVSEQPRSLLRCYVTRFLFINDAFYKTSFLLQQQLQLRDLVNKLKSRIVADSSAVSCKISDVPEQ